MVGSRIECRSIVNVCQALLLYKRIDYDATAGRGGISCGGQRGKVFRRGGCGKVKLQARWCKALGKKWQRSACAAEWFCPAVAAGAAGPFA